MGEKTKNVILYLVKKLGSQMEGRKKLMKLMFLIEHFDMGGGKIIRKHVLGNKFFIYYYGVFSFDVMNSHEELIKERKILDTFPITLRQGVETRLDEELRRVVDKIIERFGRYSGYALEVETLRMLGIEPFEKDRYFGRDVDEILRLGG